MNEPPPPVEVASWPLQLEMVTLVFASLLVGGFSTVLLVDVRGDVAALNDTLQQAIKTRDEKFADVFKRMNAQTADRYHAQDAADDFAKRDAQLERLEREIVKIKARVDALSKDYTPERAGSARLLKGTKPCRTSSHSLRASAPIWWPSSPPLLALPWRSGLSS